MATTSLLQSVLEGDEDANGILIQDTVVLSGRSLLKHCVCSLVQRYTSVHLFLFDAHHQQWSHGLPKDVTEKLILHDSYSNALGWSNDRNTSSTDSSLLCSCTLQSFLKTLGSVERSECVVIIDSLSLLLLHHPPAVVCRILQGIGTNCSILLCLLHADLHKDHVISQLCHVMSTSIVVKPVQQESQTRLGSHSGVCSIQHRRKTGRVLKKTETYSINDSFIKLMSHDERVPLTIPESTMHDKSLDPAANLTFDLRLSSKEKVDRANVVLPYTTAAVPRREVGVSSNHGTGMGQIYYQPDEVDDFDDSDPDDDLDF